MVGQTHVAADHRDARDESQRHEPGEPDQRELAERSSRRVGRAEIRDRKEVQEQEKKSEQAGEAMRPVHAIEAPEEALQEAGSVRQNDGAGHENHRGRREDLGDELDGELAARRGPYRDRVKDHFCDHEAREAGWVAAIAEAVSRAFSNPSDPFAPNPEHGHRACTRECCRGGRPRWCLLSDWR